MNKAYKVIWSKARNCYIVVSELAKRHAKAPSVTGVKGAVASVTVAAALSVMLGGYGVAWADVGDNTNTFKNFANGDLLKAKANSWLVDNEFNNSTGLYSINAHGAYALGYSGNGVTLGILDSGVRTEHAEFLGKAVNVNLNVEDEATWGWDTNGRAHGSHVAGIMAASKNGSTGMQGVAYNSIIESIATPIIDGKAKGNDSFENLYINNTDKLSASIINNSWGGKSSLFGQNSYIDKIVGEVKEKDKVFVFTAGNESDLTQEGNIIKTLCDKKELNHNILNVVSLDPATNYFAYYSGVAKGVEKNTVSAYGGGIKDIWSVDGETTTDYTEKQGTSMAAPYVTGSLALVKEAYPYFTGKQLTDSVITTTKLLKDVHVVPTFVTIQPDPNSDEQIKDINLIVVKDSKNNLSINEIKGLFNSYLKENNNAFLKSKDTKFLLIKPWLEKIKVDKKLVNDYSILFGERNISEEFEDFKNYDSVDDAYWSIISLESKIKKCNDNSALLDKISEVKNLFSSNDVDYAKYNLSDSGEELFKIVKETEDLINEQQASVLTKAVFNSYNDGNKNIKVIQMTNEQVYGQGLIDVGRAVQGIGAIDVNRLGTEDISEDYSNSKNYLYKIDTGKVEDNYNQRVYSIWSNDIGEKNIGTDGVNAGLLKTGISDVDLILLGENTYQGPTVSEFGNMHIVRGVGGDVYAKVGNVQINGYAKNIYALPDSTINISDTVRVNGYGGPDTSFLKEALPTSNTVNIEGGLFAVGYDPIANTGSEINVKLNQSDSQIKGALYQDEKSKINVELSNTAKLTVEDGKGYYASETFVGNNKLNELRMYSFGEVDLSKYPEFTTLSINKLTGNGGVFTVKTNLAERKADLIKVENANNESHYVSVIDKNGFVAVNDASVKVAEAPNSVTFKGFEQTVDQGINSHLYIPKLDYIERDGNQNDWYFYGFEGSDYNPVVEKPVVDSAIYTTNTVLNKGIQGHGTHYFENLGYKGWDDTVIKVIQAEEPAMIVNGKVEGPVRFIGDGPVKIVNDENALKYTYGHDFEASQKIFINTKGTGIDNYATKYSPYYSSTEDSNFIFKNGLDINVIGDGFTGEGGFKSVAIHNSRGIYVDGDTNINIAVSNEIDDWDHSNSITGIVNNLNSPYNQAIMNFNGNLTFTNKGHYYLPHETITCITNEANYYYISQYDDAEFYVKGDLNFKLEVPSDPTAHITLINNQSLMEIDGNINSNCGTISNSGTFSVGAINSEQGSIDITNKGTFVTKNGIKANSVFTNSGDATLGKESNLYSLRNSGNLTGETVRGAIENTGEGNLNINRLETNSIKVENSDKAIANIGALIMGSDETVGQISGQGAINVNENEENTVKIKGGIYEGVKINLKLTDKDSYFEGEFNTHSSVSNSPAEITIKNGAKWKIADFDESYSSGFHSVKNLQIAKVSLYDKGSIELPYNRNLVINELQGTGGVFSLGLWQSENDKGNLKTGVVTVGKNTTENAKHTINLTPSSADFVLTNDVTVTPFTLVEDQSENNNGHLLSFGISNFDAGVYNYTPTLESKKDGNNVNIWQVTDIKVTGSSTPEDPVKPDEPVDPKPDDPTPDDPAPVVEPVDKLLTVDTTKLTDADKTNNYGSDTVYLQKVNTGDTSGTDTIVTHEVKEVTGSDKLHGGIVAEGKNDLVLAGDNSYQGPTVSRLQDGATLQVVKGVQGDAVAEDGGSLALHGAAKGVYAAADSDVLITDTVARKVIKSSDSKAQKEAKEKFNASVPEKTTVNVTGGLFATDGNVKVDLSNSESVVRGPLYTGANGSTDITLDNGAKVIAEKGSGKYKGTDYAGNNKVTRLNINNGSMIDISGDGEISELHVETLNGAGGVFGLGIHQEAKDSGNITADKIIIDKNETKGASHTIQFTPDQADFLLSRGTKVNAFDVAEDHSEPNGGYAVKFAANNFDAGVYNYTPTIGSEKDGDNVNRWKITDIRITGSEPTPTPSPTPGPVPTPSPVPSPVPKPVLSNLTYNTQAAAINNYYRWRDEYNNLEKRLGDLRYSNEENGIWVRTFRGHEDSGKYGLNSTYTAFQLGYDRKVETKKGGKWFIGGAVTSYDGKTSFDHLGRTENKSVGLALYGSYLGSKGHYVDIVARHSRLNTELDSYATGTGAKVSGDYHNWGSSIGVEYGRRIALKKGYFVQPQAELVYGHLNSVNYNLDDGSSVSQSGVSTWLARGGVTIGRQTKKGSVYASFSVLHDFGDDSRFTIRDKYGASYSSNTNMKDTWYELSIGGNAKLSENTYMYADVEKTFGGDVRTKWRYNVGVRCSF